MRTKREIETRLNSLKQSNTELIENEIWQLALEWVLSEKKEDKIG